MKKAHIGIKFDTSKMTSEQLQAIRDAEESLGKAGVVFGHSSGTRDGKVTDITWDWDLEIQLLLAPFRHL